MTTSNVSVPELFGGALDDGDISPGSNSLLMAPDVGQQITAALGVPADQLESSEVFNFGALLDDSGSIRFGGNTEHVRDGVNMVLRELRDTNARDDMMVQLLQLNDPPVCNFTRLVNAPELDGQNYNPTGGTPLYDQSVVFLGAQLAKAREFAEQGVPCRSVSLIVSDGADVHSTRNTASDVRKLVEDMLRQETHIVAFMGIDDGDTDFRQVAREMGIPDEWVLTPGSNREELKAAFAVVSRASKTASQGAASFSQAAGGGFGTA